MSVLSQRDTSCSAYSAPGNTIQHTRQRLIEAGIRLFGEQGFKGTTTRQLAEMANANIGSIAYHFGNKHGLYLAAARYIAEALSRRLELAPEFADSLAPPLNAAHAHRVLQELLRHMVRVFTEDSDKHHWMLMVLREQAQPGEAFNILHDNAFAPAQQRISTLVACLTGLPRESRRVTLETHALIGQVLFLLFGREELLRRLGLTHFDAGTLTDIDAMIARHLQHLVGS